MAASSIVLSPTERTNDPSFFSSLPYKLYSRYSCLVLILSPLPFLKSLLHPRHQPRTMPHQRTSHHSSLQTPNPHRPHLRTHNPHFSPHTNTSSNRPIHLNPTTIPPTPSPRPFPRPIHSLSRPLEPASPAMRSSFKPAFCRRSCAVET